MKINLPIVTGLLSFLSGLWAAPGSAQALHVATPSVPVGALPPEVVAMLVNLMPVIVAAAMGGATALVAWFVKTVIGISIEAFCTFGETWADAKLAGALANKDPSDDVPTMAFTKAVKMVCAKLRKAEKSLPGHKEDKE